MRYAPPSQLPTIKALTDAIAHHEHEAEQLRFAVREFTRTLRARGHSLEEVITELRVIFGRNVHLDGSPERRVAREPRLETLLELATEGFRAAPTE